ncbi:MAG: nucleotidyltransferase domain-containing protein [Nanoarchaeota archaeon]
MILNTNNEKILELFLKKPTTGFQIRDIIRLTKIGNPTVIRGLRLLVSKKLIVKNKGRIYPFYEANLENNFFRKLKIFYNLICLEDVVKNIIKKTNPNCIVLFGSGAKGEDTEQGDIDLFVQAERKEISFSNSERKLNRKINFLFEPDLTKLNKELANNLVNGIVIYGFMELK